MGANPEVAAPEESRRLLVVDDGSGELGPLALRLGRLGMEIHYASEAQEAYLFIAQERETIRLLAAPPSIDLRETSKLLQSLNETAGIPIPFVILGEEPDEERREQIREAGVDWVLWAPFKDVELRYLVTTAMAAPSVLSQRLEPRLPVDMVVTVRSRDRREVAVLSSLSARGAFIEVSEPLPVGSQLQLEFELLGERFRGFARVVYQELESPEDPSIISGVGVSFYGVDRDMSQLLLNAVQDCEARYRP